MKNKSWLTLNKIYNEDCLNTLARIPEDYIDLTVTSPPYNIGIKYDVYKDKRPMEDYFAWTEYWLRELYRVTKEDGRVCINHYLSISMNGKRCSPISNIINIAEKIGFKFHGLAVWTEGTISKLTAWGSWLSASAPYINTPYEGVVILYKEYWKKKKKGITNISKEEFIKGYSGVWNLAAQHRKFHPTAFPESLPSRCIQLFSYEKDLVFDPFMGVGTTAVAAKRLNRNFIGAEVSKKYCDLAQKRLEEI
ncbi:MAG: site-specific DNA-methyltransferase [Bacteroidetes bacterium]|nr:MAG: site-specific DNA-methyltransferase [Bacteroidota bacterium]